jgi:hypothetical protein
VDEEAVSADLEQDDHSEAAGLAAALTCDPLLEDATSAVAQIQVDRSAGYESPGGSWKPLSLNPFSNRL